MSDVVEELTKEKAALKCIKKHVYMSIGAGAIPMPVLDIAGVTGVQIKMLADISKIYDIKFTENTSKNIISALLGGLGPVVLAKGALGSMVKSIPGAGSILGMATVSGLAAASTYATGKVFIQHFESGGTFLTFKPALVREYYAEQVKEGKNFASDSKKK